MSIVPPVELSYYCDKCQLKRSLEYPHQMIKSNLIPRENGLFLLSDIHTCRGTISLNNLYIDHNYNVRSFDRLQLPEYRKSGGRQIPIPGRNSEELKTMKITHIRDDLNFKLKIIEGLLNVEIEIGDFSSKDELPIKTFESDLGLVRVSYFSSDVIFTPIMEKWINHFTTILEILPPTNLGVLIETLRYIIDNSEAGPSSFDLQFMKTILAAHEIYINEIYSIPKDFNYIQQEYDLADDYIDQIIELLGIIENNQDLPLQEFSKLLDKDIVHTLYLILILEVEGVIILNRPGIVSVM